MDAAIFSLVLIIAGYVFYIFNRKAPSVDKVKQQDVTPNLTKANELAKKIETQEESYEQAKKRFFDKFNPNK